MSFLETLLSKTGVSTPSTDYATLPISKFVGDFSHDFWTTPNGGSKHHNESIKKIQKFVRFDDFSVRPLSNYNSLHLYAFRDYMLNSHYNYKAKSYGVTNATANNYKACLSKVFNRAYQWDIIPKKPWMEQLPTTQQRRRVLTTKEQKDLVDFFKDSEWQWVHHLNEIALTTGMRKAEVLGINQTPKTLPLDWKTYGTVSAAGKYVVLYETKNTFPREVPLPPRAQKALKALNGKPLEFYNVHSFYKAWHDARYAIAKNDSSFTYHALRHTFASTMANAPISLNIAVLAEILGHKSIQTTKRYVHGDRQAMYDVVSGL